MSFLDVVDTAPIDTSGDVLNSGTISGGNYLTPSDVFGNDAFNLFKATGANDAQAGQVVNSLEGVGKSISNFFGDLLTPNSSPKASSDATPSDSPGPGGNGVSNQAPAINPTPDAPRGGITLKDVLTSPGGKVAAVGGAGIATILGGSAALTYASQQFDKSLGLPSSSGIGGIVVIGLLVLGGIILMMAVK